MADFSNHRPTHGLMKVIIGIGIIVLIPILIFAVIFFPMYIDTVSRKDHMDVFYMPCSEEFERLAKEKIPGLLVVEIRGAQFVHSSGMSERPGATFIFEFAEWDGITDMQKNEMLDLSYRYLKELNETDKILYKNEWKINDDVRSQIEQLQTIFHDPMLFMMDKKEHKNYRKNFPSVGGDIYVYITTLDDSKGYWVYEYPYYYYEDGSQWEYELGELGRGDVEYIYE